ncbi:hypothetical protein [Hornefia butyriciproducens]|uniref:hypothetical protein n=1 Tax=Hornefia butyriciproducens TaxID=2652293 RepID=UPI003F8A1376
MKRPRRKSAAEEENERLEYEGLCAQIDRALTGRKHMPEKEVVEAQKRKGRKTWKKK